MPRKGPGLVAWARAADYHDAAVRDLRFVAFNRQVVPPALGPPGGTRLRMWW